MSTKNEEVDSPRTTGLILETSSKIAPPEEFPRALVRVELEARSGRFRPTRQGVVVNSYSLVNSRGDFVVHASTSLCFHKATTVKRTLIPLPRHPHPPAT